MTPEELQTFRTPVDMTGRSVEVLDIPRGLRAVVASVDGIPRGKANPVDGIPRGKANPVAGEWLVRIDGRLFAPSADVERFNRIPGDKITSAPFRSFKAKRNAVAFLRREITAGRFVAPDLARKKDSKK